MRSKNNMNSARYESILSRLRFMSRDMGIDRTLKLNDVDVIIGPADSAFNLLACAAGE